MLTKLLSLSSSIQAYHEPDPKLVLESFLYYNRQLYFKKNPELWADLIKYARHNLMLRAHWLNRIYFESNNRLSLITDLLNSIFPNAKYIHIVRHPFDFVRSAINRGYYYDNSWDFARIRPKANDVMHASWSNTKRIEKCAWLWNATNQHIVYFLKKIPSENKMTLKAENLFSSDYKVISRIFNFISNGIRPPSKKIIDKKLKKKINASKNKFLPPLKLWSQDDKNTVIKHTYDLMNVFEYET